MTLFGWDASHHDWGRGPMDIGAAVRDGISFGTHKVGESRTFTDDRFDDWYARARAAGMGLLGGYYVNHPGDQVYQADRFLALLDARAPGWRNGPFILQVDAEKFDYMERAPNLAEIRAFCARLVSRTGGRYRPLVYAPRWLYGDTLRGLGYPLWASNYGSNPAVHYRQAYPGDNSTRWAAYSGQTPVILQYGSRTIIGRQPTCDANAYRGTLNQLRTLVFPGGQIQPPPVQGDNMLGFVRSNDPAQPQVYIGDGITRRPVDQQDITDIRFLAREGWLGPLARGGEIRTAANVDTFGQLSPPVVLTDAQVDRIAQQLIAATNVPLGEADKPAIIAAVKQALREGAV